MLNAIILTTTKAKVYREAFGLNNNGDLFIVLNKSGINNRTQNLIFTFTAQGICIESDYVKVVESYFVNFEDKSSKSFINDIHYEIIDKMESLYKLIIPEKKGALKYVGNTMNNLIQTIVKFIYFHLQRYLKNKTNIEVSRKGINLKRRGYWKIVQYVDQYYAKNKKTLVIGVFFLYLHS